MKLIGEKMNIDETIAILEAIKRGWEIQYRAIGNSIWSDLGMRSETTGIDTILFEYRMRPHPREIWIPPEQLPKQGKDACAVVHSEPTEGCVKFRQVIE